jgi:hypothetical protein
MTDYTNDPEYREWENHVRDELIPMISSSAVTISMVPSEADVKYAVELGLSIMLDKPIIALVVPGSTIPNALARAADEIVEIDLKNMHLTQKSVTAAFERVMRSQMGNASMDEEGAEGDD